MSRSAPKLIVIGIWAALLVLAGMPTGAQRTTAAPLAVVTGTEQPTRTPLPTDTPAPATPTATHRPDSGIADPAITKAVNVDEARIGDEVTFTIVVTNRGTDNANDVVVTDPFPEYLDVIEATTTRGNITSSGRTVVFTIGELKPGDTVTIRIRTRVNALAQPPEGGNVATLTSGNGTDDPSNNSATVTFRIVGPPTPTAELVATSTATPVPVPSNLPKTGAADTSPTALLALFGLLALATSLLLRRGARK
jgi:uncharacterized repeat protein (TIGR01451 family)/LPXTG-motif cell wall-anchored protein